MGPCLLSLQKHYDGLKFLNCDYNAQNNGPLFLSLKKLLQSSQCSLISCNFAIIYNVVSTHLFSTIVLTTILVICNKVKKNHIIRKLLTLVNLSHDTKAPTSLVKFLIINMIILFYDENKQQTVLGVSPSVILTNSRT